MIKGIQAMAVLLMALGAGNIGEWAIIDPNHAPGSGLVMLFSGVIIYIMVEIERAQ